MMRRVLIAALLAGAGGVDMSLTTTRRRAMMRTATAAATAAATPAFAAKTYVSGKNPDGPREKGDTKGTKKDGSYLTEWNQKILCRVLAESARRPPRHQRDACSMAW